MGTDEKDLNMGNGSVRGRNGRPFCLVQRNVHWNSAFARDHIWNDCVSYRNAAADRACVSICDAEPGRLQKKVISGRQTGDGGISKAEGEGMETQYADL